MRMEGVLNYYDAWPPVLQGKQWSVEYSNYYPSLSGTVTYNSLPANPGELFRTEVRVFGSNVNVSLGVVVGVPYNIPPPSIHVEYLSDDPNNPYGPLIVTPTSLPTVTFSETHTPMPGDDQKVGEEWNPGSEPVVTWNRPSIVSSAEFYDPNTNEFIIPQDAESYVRFTGLDEIEVNLEARASNEYGENIGGQSVRFKKVLPMPILDHFRLFFESDTISNGESNKIFLQAKDANDNDIDIPLFDEFTIVYDPVQYGRIFVDNQIIGKPVLSKDVKKIQKLKNIHLLTPLTQALNSNSASITFSYGDAINGSLVYVADGVEPIQDTPIILRVKKSNLDEDVGYSEFTIKINTILLGESKYYYVVNSIYNPLKLIIKETNNPLSFNTDDQTEFLEPVIATNAINNDHLGVYWEINTQNGNTSGDSPSQILRLVGLYWKRDTSYVVSLHARNGIKEGFLNVTVVKPSRLIAENQKNTYEFANDVFGNSFSIDEMCITWGGRVGIPPQMIKAQIFQETGFKPLYRYEPFQDVNGRNEFDQSKYNRFRILSASNLGLVDMPTTHVNLNPTYLGYVGTVWDYFSNNSRTINPNAATRILDMYNSEGVSLWYESAVIKWNKIFDFNRLNDESIDTSRARANRWLQYEYKKGNIFNTPAQTRMASSYGMLQLSYGTSIISKMMNYSVDDLHSPELLNENDNIFYFATKYLTKLMDDIVGNKKYDWENGFEHTFRLIFSHYRNDYIVDKTTNKDVPSFYGNNIVLNSIIFYPRK